MKKTSICKPAATYLCIVPPKLLPPALELKHLLQEGKARITRVTRMWVSVRTFFRLLTLDKGHSRPAR